MTANFRVRALARGFFLSTKLINQLHGFQQGYVGFLVRIEGKLVKICDHRPQSVMDAEFMHYDPSFHSYFDFASTYAQPASVVFAEKKDCLVVNLFPTGQRPHSPIQVFDNNIDRATRRFCRRILEKLVITRGNSS
jgi:hypothetical protein